MEWIPVENFPLARSRIQLFDSKKSISRIPWEIRESAATKVWFTLHPASDRLTRVAPLICQWCPIYPNQSSSYRVYTFFVLQWLYAVPYFAINKWDNYNIIPVSTRNYIYQHSINFCTYWIFGCTAHCNSTNFLYLFAVGVHGCLSLNFLWFCPWYSQQASLLSTALMFWSSTSSKASIRLTSFEITSTISLFW